MVDSQHRMIVRLAGGVAALVILSAGPARANVVADWNAIMVRTLYTRWVAAHNPAELSRMAAIVQTSVYDAELIARIARCQLVRERGMNRPCWTACTIAPGKSRRSIREERSTRSHRAYPRSVPMAPTDAPESCARFRRTLE
jgi:hypothetical protein